MPVVHTYRAKTQVPLYAGVVHPALLQRRHHQRHAAVPQHLSRQRLPAHHALAHTDLLQQPRQGVVDNQDLLDEDFLCFRFI